MLCGHFTRNLAYYSAAFSDNQLKKNSPFCRTSTNNFLDICVLEWCKLFGDHKDKHHWKQIINNPKNFKESMFKELNIKQTDLDKAWGGIKSYRDKFVAHLDDEEVMNIPHFDLPLTLVKFYHKTVLDLFEESWSKENLVLDLDKFYEACLEEAKRNYESE